MFYSIFFALLNGICIGSSRVINGQLSSKLNPLKASFCNHLVGFLFLSLLFLLSRHWPSLTASVPVVAFLGGIFGALFVAVSSYVFPRLGATHTALLIISGQMISAAFFDFQKNVSIDSVTLKTFGIIFVLMGIYFSRKNHDK